MCRLVSMSEGKIHPLPRDTVIKILQSNGFVHIKGSHRHMKFKKFDENKVCVATTMVSHCPTIVPNIIRCIIRQSKKPEHEFY